MSFVCDLCEVNVEGMISQEIKECHLNVRMVKKMKALQKRCLEPRHERESNPSNGGVWQINSI